MVKKNKNKNKNKDDEVFSNVEDEDLDSLIRQQESQAVRDSNINVLDSIGFRTRKSSRIQALNNQIQTYNDDDDDDDDDDEELAEIPASTQVTSEAASEAASQAVAQTSKQTATQGGKRRQKTLY